MEPLYRGAFSPGRGLPGGYRERVPVFHRLWMSFSTFVSITWHRTCPDGHRLAAGILSRRFDLGANA
jgi:hypothetical protein